MAKTPNNRTLRIRKSCKKCHHSYSIELREVVFDKLDDRRSDNYNRKLLEGLDPLHIEVLVTNVCCS